MKTVLALSCAALMLAGCARFNERAYGSWLDSVGMPAPASARLSPEETKAFQLEADRLHAEAETVRVKMGSEKDRVRRIAYLKALRDIDDRLVPVERALRSGPTPLTLPTPEPASAGG
jgi:hypothetical protein